MLFPALTTRGGTPRLFLSLARELRAQGHEVKLYTELFHPEKCYPELNRDLDIVAMRTVGNYSQNSKAILPRLAMGYDYLFRMRKLSRIIDRDVDILNPHEALVYIAARRLRTGEKIPIVWSCYDPASYVDKNRIGMLYNANPAYRLLVNAFSLYDRIVIRGLDRVIVPTQRMKKMLDSFYRIYSSITRTSGIDPLLFKPDPSGAARRALEDTIPAVRGSAVLLSVGAHFWHRRYEDVMLAVKRLVSQGFNIHYMIVGSNITTPDYTVHLQRLVSILGLEQRVHFSDASSDGELLGYYRSCDVFVFPCESESWGQAPLEALAVGKPVVVSSGCGVTEVLGDEEHCLVVPPRRPDLLCESLKRILTDLGLQKRLASNGRNFVLMQHTWSKCAERLTSTLNDAVLRWQDAG